MKLAVWLCRLILGSTFMLSGAAKMIDPTGTLLKIEAYLSAWDWSVPSGLTLLGGCMLAMVEFICGFMLATGSLRRVAVWCATAIMACMLPLTAYIALANPVDDCGCFGDFLVISNAATFVKNLFLTAMALFLLRHNRLCRGLFTPWSQWLQIAFAVVYMAAIGLIGYHEQPLVDFRPYPVGECVADNQGAEMRYVYKAPDGSIHEFADDELPDDDPDDDQGWEFLNVKEIAPASGKMLALFDRQSGDDVTDRVLSAPNLILFLFPEPSAATAAGSYTANELHAAMSRRFGPGSFVGVTAADSIAVDMALDLMMADYPVYYADPKAIKTMARGDMAAVYLRNDTVMWKRKLASINLDLLETPHVDIAVAYQTHGPALFWRFTLLFLAAEALLALLGLCFQKLFAKK